MFDCNVRSDVRQFWYWPSYLRFEYVLARLNLDNAYSAINMRS